MAYIHSYRYMVENPSVGVIQQQKIKYDNYNVSMLPAAALIWRGAMHSFFESFLVTLVTAFPLDMPCGMQILVCIPQGK